MNNMRGAVLMIISMGIFAVEDLLIKKASVLLPIGEILLVIGLFGAALLALLVTLKRQSLVPRELRDPNILMRNAGEVAGVFGFALLLAAIFLGERPATLTLIGAMLIIASGLYALARERALFSEAHQG